MSFHHGDTSPKNVIIGDDLKVTLIDWGGSGFYESSRETEDFGLSYAFNHIEVMRKYREPVLQKICQQRQLEYEVYSKRIHRRSRDIKIADITWAYWMYCQTANGIIAERPETYKQILDQRIDEFESQFEHIIS
jgi:thiamine kinase-like enzyme